MELGTLMASAPLVQAASRALTHASDRVARAMAIRCLQRLPVPLEGTLLNYVTDANILAMCHAMGPQAVAALVCGKDFDSEMERWGHKDSRYHVAILLDALNASDDETSPPDHFEEVDEDGVRKVFNLLQEQPCAESWTLIRRYKKRKKGPHLLINGDGFEYAAFRPLTQPAYYLLAGSQGMPTIGGPPDLLNLLMQDKMEPDAIKKGISVLDKIVELTRQAYDELGRPGVISQEWLKERYMAGRPIVRQEDTPCHSKLAILKNILKMNFEENVALASLEYLFLAWLGSASSVKTVRHPQGGGLVSSCIGANCGVGAAVVLPGLRHSKINIYSSEHGMQVVYLPGFNTAVILPGAGEEPRVDRALQLVGFDGKGAGILLPFLVKVLKSGILKESTQPACRALAREIGNDLLAVLSPVSEGLLRAFRDTKLPPLSKCFERNPDLTEHRICDVMQWIGVRWLEGPAGDFACVLRNDRIAFEYFFRTSSLRCEVDCLQNMEGRGAVSLPDGRLGLVAERHGDKATKILPLVDVDGRDVKCGVHQLRGNKMYRCTSWEPVSTTSVTPIERPLYVG